MMTARILVPGMVILLLGACGRAGTSSPASVTATPVPIPTATPAVPADKYVLVERWVEVYEDSTVKTLADSTTYAVVGGALKPDMVSEGEWFRSDDLAGVVVVYGRGARRTGGAGGGTSSGLFAATGFPFTEPASDDSDVPVSIEGVDGHGTVYLRRGDQEIVLQPSQAWTTDGEITVVSDGIGRVISRREGISNHGLLDKSKIELVK